MKNLLLLVIIPSLLAQDPKAAYDVASIKPNKSGTPFSSIGGTGGRFTATNTTARQLILNAYGISDFQLVGGPGWLDSDRFDLEATPLAGTTSATDREQAQLQTRTLLRAILEDRFRLKVHRETKEVPVYGITITKQGAKLKPSADQSPVAAGVGAAPGGRIRRGGIRTSPGNISASAITLARLARTIEGQLGRPVVDKTGLTGLFDIEFTWTPDRPVRPIPGLELPPVDPNGPSLTTALQEQLGLRLESGTGPVEVVVIESIEKPSEN